MKSTESSSEESESAIRQRIIEPTLLADLLPHLKSYRGIGNLNARVLLKAKNTLRSPPELLLMIPSTSRKDHNYLNDTLHNLLNNMIEAERHLMQIVVMLSENPWEQNAETQLMNTVKDIERNFGKEIEEGLIEVVAPPPKWFPPNLEHIQPTLGDSPERMRWRAKQSLDYAFAMYHTYVERPNARFYVQLEDDIITVPGFLSEMHRFANAHPNFFMCEFSNLGFIGRIFHNGIDISHMAHFILLLYRSLPVDWILSTVINAKFCSLDETWKTCLKKHLNDIVLFRRSPPLFQHVGRHSSLPGKMQNLTEKQFGKNIEISPLRDENPQLTGEIHSEVATIEQWRAFYEQYIPVQLNRTDLTKDTIVELDYGNSTLPELKGLRIMFSVKFHVDLASVPLPDSFLIVRITHSSSDNHTVNSDFPAPKSPPVHDHFLLIAKPILRNVRSIHISLKSSDWRNTVEWFTLSSLHIIT